MYAPSDDTIVALATPVGAGAIGVIRVSGRKAIEICESIFKTQKHKKLSDQKTHTAHFGSILNGDKIIDDVVTTLFISPHSYTGEDVVEFSCHGSPYILKTVLELLKTNGCRMAEPGEFTLRAFLNGKLDLSQAEAVADIIASESEMSHKIAFQQMRKGYSNGLKKLRDQLINFVSSVELELDFSEEDITFFDKNQLITLLQIIENKMETLVMSFSTGNAIKKGIPVVIVGNPNVGKSTLLNAILNEDRAIVSPIAGTTRDFIEDKFVLEGVVYRFIDTAGIRNADDSLEMIGIEKTHQKMADAALILYIFDVGMPIPIDDIMDIKTKYPKTKIIPTANKIDLFKNDIPEKILDLDVVKISAKNKNHLDLLLKRIHQATSDKQVDCQVVVSNARHHEALKKALISLKSAKKGLENEISGDLLAIDLREVLYQIGLITGEVSSDDLLGNIFSNFCIGK